MSGPLHAGLASGEDLVIGGTEVLAERGVHARPDPAARARFDPAEVVGRDACLAGERAHLQAAQLPNRADSWAVNFDCGSLGHDLKVSASISFR